MIGEALYDLLSTNPAIIAMVGNRVSSISFREAEVLPGLNYNTRSVVSVPCRNPGQDKTGILEIGMLAGNEVELERLSDTVTSALDRYQGVHLGYALYIEANDNDFDENVEDLNSFYKALQFDFTASKL